MRNFLTILIILCLAQLANAQYQHTWRINQVNDSTWQVVHREFTEPGPDGAYNVCQNYGPYLDENQYKDLLFEIAQTQQQEQETRQNRLDSLNAELQASTGQSLDSLTTERMLSRIQGSWVATYNGNSYDVTIENASITNETNGDTGTIQVNSTKYYTISGIFPGPVKINAKTGKGTYNGKTVAFKRP